MSRIHRPRPLRALRSLAGRVARLEVALHAAQETLARVPPPPYVPVPGEVVRVRDATGCSVHDARDAVVRARGDFVRACEIVRRRGLA